MLNLDFSYASSLVQGRLYLNPTQPRPGSRCFPGEAGAHYFHLVRRGKHGDEENRGVGVRGPRVSLVRGACGPARVHKRLVQRGREGFECGGCGSEMTLADRVVAVRPETAGMAPDTH